MGVEEPLWPPDGLRFGPPKTREEDDEDMDDEDAVDNDGDLK